MKVIIVDDEPIALEMLQRMISAHDEIDILGCYTKPMLALKEIEKIKPDVVFLDIEMGPINGLEIGQLMLNKADNMEVVFVTAFSRYALEAFELNAIDYILKPVREDRLIKTISRLKENLYGRKDKNGKETCAIEIRCFGGFDIFDPKGEIVHWRTRKTKELLAFLWHRSDGIVDKETIIDEIFPDKNYDQATTLLYTTVYQLRNSLKKLGIANGVIYVNEGYKLNINCRSDLDDIADILSPSKEKAEEKDIKRLVDIYRGDYLKEAYSWVQGAQENYRALVLRTLSEYVCGKIDNRGFDSDTRRVLEKILEIEPFDDQTAELGIKYFGEQGSLIGLEAFYKRYTSHLKEEMGIEPSDGIRELYTKYVKTLT